MTTLLTHLSYLLSGLLAVMVILPSFILTLDLSSLKDAILSFADIRHKLNTEFGINYDPCPVGARYIHG